MESPEGNGRSTDEGRNGALLLLRGGLPVGGDDPPDRASALPSSNALRPDSNLNLGWYRPAEREDSEGRSACVDDALRGRGVSQSSGEEPTIAAAAALLDLVPGPAPRDLGDLPLGVRRSTRNTPSGASLDRARATRLGRGNLHTLRRWVEAGVATTARATGKRRMTVVAGGMLLLALLSGVAVVLVESGSPGHSARPPARSALSQLPRALLSDVTSSVASLGRAGREPGALASARRRSPEPRPRRSAASRARPSHNHGRGSAGPAPVSHVTSTGPAVSAEKGNVGTDSSATSAHGASQQASVAPETARQTPIEDAPLRQPVHYQAPSQPAGPAGLGSQVGSNCNPKCS
jgi:hypothetical protein